MLSLYAASTFICALFYMFDIKVKLSNLCIKRERFFEKDLKFAHIY